LAAILIIIETLIPLRAPLKERSTFANAWFI
jgi:hypothetical protein